MKRLLFAALIVAACATASAQDSTKVQVTKQGKTFTATNVEKQRGNGYTPTGYTYIDTDGKAYEIHTHTTQNGKNKGKTKCYIKRTSKESGKQYWKAITVKPEELK